MSEKCETCRYWDNSTQLARAPDDETGACRISPPVVDKRTGQGVWPYTSFEDWCACHKPAPDEDEEARF